MKKTKIEYPKQKTTVLRQKATNDENFEKTLLEENQRLKQQIDEIKNQKDLGLLGGNVDTSNLQAKLTAGQNITISDNNVISATDTTYTAGTNITITNGVISATGGGDTSELQNQINNFISMINDRNAIYNTSYNGIDQSTVVRTYDYIDKQYNFSGTSAFNSSIFNFCVGTTDTMAKLKITIKIKGQSNGGLGVLNLYHNSSDFTSSEVFSYDSTLDFKEVIFDLNISSPGNSVSFTISSLNNVSFELTYAKVEVYNCTNPTFLNVIKKFDVQNFNGKYYITNCTGKTAKYCIINQDNLTSTQDITWTDTNIEAQFMTFCATITGSDNQCVVNEVSKVFLLQNCSIYFENANGTLTINTYPFGYGCGLLPSTYTAQISTNFINLNSVCAYRYSCSTNNTSLLYSYSTNNTISNIVGSKRNSYYHTSPSQFYYIAQNMDGTATFKYSNSRTINLGYGVAMGSYVQDSTYKTYNLYVKVYDKMIRHNLTYTGTSPNYFTLNSSEVIGYYDDYFEGNNNDYFVVKNNKLYYYVNLPQNS